MNKSILVIALGILMSACSYETPICEDMVNGDAFVGKYSFIDQEDGQEYKVAIIKTQDGYLADDNILDQTPAYPAKFCEINGKVMMEVKMDSEAYQLTEVKVVSEKSASMSFVSFDTDILKEAGVVVEGLFGAIKNTENDREAMLKAMSSQDELILTKIK